MTEEIEGRKDRHPVSAYFKTKKAKDITEANLWTSLGPDDFGGDEAAYRSAILSQYELYVEMADRVSQRRGTANTFFITLNTGVFALIAGVFEGRVDAPGAILAVVTLVLVAQCLVWFWILRSYRQLNSAKWKIVGEMEKCLPAKPWSDAEWVSMGSGKEPAVYWPLSKVEAFVPALFAAAYVATLVILLVLD